MWLAALLHSEIICILVVCFSNYVLHLSGVRTVINTPSGSLWIWQAFSYCILTQAHSDNFLEVLLEAWQEKFWIGLRSTDKTPLHVWKQFMFLFQWGNSWLKHMSWIWSVAVIILRCPVTRYWFWSELWANDSYLFAVHFNVSNIVLKHGGHVHLWKLVLAEHDEQTGLPTGSISHYDQLFPDRCHRCRQDTETNKGYDVRTLYL